MPAGGGGSRAGGARYNRPPEVPAAHWLPYVHLPSADLVAKLATEHGGKVMHGPMEVPGGDRIAIMMDPQGAPIAAHAQPYKTPVFKALARDLGKSLEQYYAASARAYLFGEILRQFVRLGQRYRIRLPREWLLVMKVFMVVEAQASALDPAFDMASALQRYTPPLLRRELLP